MLRPDEQLLQTRIVPCVRPIHIALLLLILAGATLLRVHNLSKTSYWYDEICSVLYARGQTAAIFHAPNGYFETAPAIASHPGNRPWRDVWFGFDTTPPLYPTVLRLWWHVFGESEISGRLLSVFMSVLTIAALFDFARLILSPAAALWSCALCAASPPMVRYAQEARSYALLSLLGVLICSLVLRITQTGGSRRRYLLLWALCAAALLTHHFIAGGILAAAVYGIISLRGRERLALVGVIAAAFVVEAWQIPMLLSHAQSLHHGNEWMIEPRAGLIGRTLSRFAWLPLVYLILPTDSPMSGFSIVLLILPAVLRKQIPALLLAGMWSVGLMGLVAASDLWLGHGALLYARYTLAAAPMVFVTLAAVADLAGKWVRHLLPAVTVAGALLAIPETYSDQIWIKPESRQMAADVKSHVEPGDILVVASPPHALRNSAGEQYLAIDFYAGPLPCAVAILEAPADQTVRRAIWSHKRVWLMRTFAGLIDSAQIDPNDYLGPCTLSPAGDTRLFAGRLFRALPRQ